ncbi:hypothetical protein TPHA_0F02510 [Tetrapisispora phaffii CBS 4417]|uniref:Uncharacterized protein n=1 Tax=Tetrapisispora phaffii (strain ATCC 24235 / CBS 4417 / NBRC 1672 / NRRL Y-8282 / UCD 70-5) TaxID=1071381 RepID=G8BUE6_TETPH|nr:hypothetical protein TPHA_0F02510 [Tetrapisispora phaffii CBS 4417]CCE63732.1 hypothetical protein TPHA_0F02510 [Tetrapisispora phaffii CBS 4417]
MVAIDSPKGNTEEIKSYSLKRKKILNDTRNTFRILDESLLESNSPNSNGKVHNLTTPTSSKLARNNNVRKRQSKKQKIHPHDDKVHMRTIFGENIVKTQPLKSVPKTSTLKEININSKRGTSKSHNSVVTKIHTKVNDHETQLKLSSYSKSKMEIVDSEPTKLNPEQLVFNAVERFASKVLEKYSDPNH